MLASAFVPTPVLPEIRSPVQTSEALELPMPVRNGHGGAMVVAMRSRKVVGVALLQGQPVPGSPGKL